ncbi:protein kinase [Psychromonas sp. MB-3u-54]|uniref:protein kinase domain-containing protein n=1 Tax=Psychromonas sp. MB-3u-54 TaxID=2058319 RepID=UPI000C345BF8|nr:protein kinase [Psychromonas sp. MB-3u-54]PKH03113.1 protein kinase [Psychromonas sp. MB-3u-54]
MTKDKKKIVYDSLGNEYELTGKVGEGGQGMVCSTDRKNILVKVINTSNKTKIDKAIKKIQWVSQQSLGDLNIALPKIAITRPKQGYVMELMDGLISLQTVIDQSFNDLQENESTEEYLKSGGVERRIKLLLAITTTLSELHSRGYAYGDLSPENIFVSENIAHSQVWFIDCDNISFNEREGDASFYTPSYGAPEIVKDQQNVNCLTDAWSFAVIAFELLTHQHPFKGLYVDDGEPEVVEQQAFEGELPWVYDLEDFSNESVGGIPLDLVANTNIIGLFRQCFEEGKNNPLKRPSLSQWRMVLQEAIDQTIHCQHCRHQFFYSSNETEQICPFCDSVAEPNTFKVFEQVIVDDQGEFCLINNIRILNMDCTQNYNSSPYATELWNDSATQLEVRWCEDKIHLKPVNGSKVLIHKGDNSREFTREAPLPLSNSTIGIPYYVSTWNPSKITSDEHLNLIQSYRWRFV